MKAKFISSKEAALEATKKKVESVVPAPTINTKDIKVISQKLKYMEIDLERNGLKPNSPEFQKQLMENKIESCQNARGVSSCGSCNYNEHCSLLYQYVLTEKYS